MIEEFEKEKKEIEKAQQKLTETQIDVDTQYKIDKTTKQSKCIPKNTKMHQKTPTFEDRLNKTNKNKVIRLTKNIKVCSNDTKNDK